MAGGKGMGRWVSRGRQMCREGRLVQSGAHDSLRLLGSPSGACCPLYYAPMASRGTGGGWGGFPLGFSWALSSCLQRGRQIWLPW